VKIIYIQLISNIRLTENSKKTGKS